MPSKPAMSKVSWEPLHEVIYRELRSAIITARYAPGETLTVRATARSLGVSPMPVRAAFTRLVAELAVNSLANGTVVIPKMRRDRFDELVELRILLEGTATGLAASRVTSSELDEMEAIATRLTDAAKFGSADDYLELNQRFKFAIYDAARAPVLKDLIERLWLQIGPFMRFYSRDIKIQVETDEQWAALAALRSGDGATARRAIEADIRAGGVFLLEVGEFDDTSEQL